LGDVLFIASYLQKLSFSRLIFSRLIFSHLRVNRLGLSRFRFSRLKTGCSLLMLNSLWVCAAYAEISMSEVQPLKFPTALMHLDRNTVVEVNWKGEIGNSTNTTLLDDDYHQGRYLVTSDTGSLISLDIVSLANEPFIDLNRIRVRYKNKTYNSFPVSGLANPGVNGEFIEIGAKAVAKKKASQGVKNPQYVLTILEQ
jgi:hypothetical protein